MRTLPLLVATLFLLPLPIFASVIGTNPPAPSITAERIAQLPAAQRDAWTAYLRRSKRQRRVDRATLAAERKGMKEAPPMPKEGSSARSMPLNRDAAWYAGAEARHIADTIVSFQTPAGGWSKNLDMTGPKRQRGQSYTPDNLSHYLAPGDFDTPRDPSWNYVGTLDNDATTTELRFLARVADALPAAEGRRYREAFLRGVHYLLRAQFPNGGWPQVWPLEGGYHDAITFNDNALTEAADVLTDVAAGKAGTAFVPAELRRESGAAAARAIDCILKAQRIVHERRTVWAQQQDALTFVPVSARNFEPPALSSGESAHLLIYLMALPHPSMAVRAAVESGIAWLRASAIYNVDWTGGRGTPGGRHLVPSPGAGPLWARYYSLTTGKPIFADRDKSIHDDVNELSLERRNGYAWYSAAPQEAIDRYALWSAAYRHETAS